MARRPLKGLFWQLSCLEVWILMTAMMQQTLVLTLWLCAYCSYESCLWEHELRYYQRCAVLFGVLIQLQRLHTDASPKLPSNVDTNTLDMSVTVPRFTYLPIRYSTLDIYDSSSKTAFSVLHIDELEFLLLKVYFGCAVLQYSQAVVHPHCHLGEALCKKTGKQQLGNHSQTMMMLPNLFSLIPSH